MAMSNSGQVQNLMKQVARRLPRSVVESVKGLLVDPVAYQRAASENVARQVAGDALYHDADYASEIPVTIGIIRDADFYYCYNVAACVEHRIRYVLVDIMRPDWIERIREAACDAWLVYPVSYLSVHKQMYDEKLKVMEQELGCALYPGFDALWIWESKRRMHYWLRSHDIPHPRTWVFASEREAREFVSNCPLPIVAKTDIGATAKGVFILRTRAEALRLVKKAFGKGIVPRSMARQNRQWGYAIFQEFVSHDYEYRIVRIDGYYLCRRKTRVGDFASGGGAIIWYRPSTELLDFVELVTEAGKFRSMALDIFVRSEPDGTETFLVNELQALFGRIEKEKNQNDATGRWYRDEGGIWRFEPGFFYTRACADLRLEMILRDLENKRTV